MKLDKIRFAKVVAFIGRQFNSAELSELDSLIDIAVPEIPQGKADAEQLERLMFLMAQGTRKIEAIKYHRTLTGYELKESKEAVEKYWVSKPSNEGATFSEILDTATKPRWQNF